MFANVRQIGEKNTKNMKHKFERAIKHFDLKKGSQKREKVFMRMFLFRKMYNYGMTMHQIKDMFEIQDHTTVLHGLRKYEIERETLLFQQLTAEISQYFNDIQGTQSEMVTALVSLENQIFGR